MAKSDSCATLILVMIFTLAITLTQGRHLKLDTKKEMVHQPIFVVAIKGRDQGNANSRTSPTNGHQLAHDLHSEPILGALGEVEGSPIQAPSQSDQGTHHDPKALHRDYSWEPSARIIFMKDQFDTGRWLSYSVNSNGEAMLPVRQRVCTSIAFSVYMSDLDLPLLPNQLLDWCDKIPAEATVIPPEGELAQYLWSLTANGDGGIYCSNRAQSLQRKVVNARRGTSVNLPARENRCDGHMLLLSFIRLAKNRDASAPAAAVRLKKASTVRCKKPFVRRRHVFPQPLPALSASLCTRADHYSHSRRFLLCW
ncbi:hypothetical protein Scep_001671 [Stephania cephalantha]|uniref:Uncharacterized protein n=1 Tax=Stephania cephalantha TaxID=152367 RepID=A0AAP0Q3Z7_9MAGN